MLLMVITKTVTVLQGERVLTHRKYYGPCSDGQLLKFVIGWNFRNSDWKKIHFKEDLEAVRLPTPATDVSVCKLKNAYMVIDCHIGE